jgi:hypothetical protein
MPLTSVDGSKGGLCAPCVPLTSKTLAPRRRRTIARGGARTAIIPSLPRTTLRAAANAPRWTPKPRGRCAAAR